MTNPTHARVLILGSGPAGLTAALYAARANLEPLVVEGTQPGGQLTITTEVENYPGFPDGIMGPELMELFARRRSASAPRSSPATSTAVDLCDAAVHAHARRRRRSPADTLDHRDRRARRSCSASSRRRALMGHGVSACATCDGFFFKDKECGRRRRRHRDGGGDLPHQVREQGDGRAPARRAPRVEDHAGPRAQEPEDRVRSGTRRGRRDPRRRRRARRDRRDAQGHAHGRARRSRPTASSWRSATSRTRSSSRASSRWTRTATSSPSSARRETNVPGVFACGDVQDHVYRQAITAAGSGCMAAIDAERFLEAQGHH